MWTEYKPKIIELAKENSFYSISTELVLGYYKYLLCYDFIDFQSWLRKKARDYNNFLHNYFEKIVLQYQKDGIFQVFLTPYNIIIRENDDDYYLNNGVILQKEVEIYKDLKEINNEDIGEIFSNEEKVNYFIYNFTKFAEEAKVIKNIIDQKNKEIRNKYISEKEKNIKRGNKLILKHNEIRRKRDIN